VAGQFQELPTLYVTPLVPESPAQPARSWIASALRSVGTAVTDLLESSERVPLRRMEALAARLFVFPGIGFPRLHKHTVGNACVAGESAFYGPPLFARVLKMAE
jgi:hypothetical protein